MRLFVAVDLPEAVRQSAATAGARLRDALGRVPTRSRVTWVAPPLLHLTVTFLGEVDEATGAEVVGRLQQPLDLAPVTLGLGNAGVFPTAGRPRVLWLAVTDGAGALGEVQAAVEQRLQGLRYRREDRPFAPHLTLARFKEGGSMDDRRAVERAQIEASPSGLVDHVTLYRSRLSPKGPEYTVLAESRLAGGAAR